MFLGVTSSRNSGVRRWRRQRLRSATATARLASFWPTMCSSSAATIALGVRLSVMSGIDLSRSNRFERHIAVGENADVGCHLHCLARDYLGIVLVFGQRAGGGERVIPA